MGYAFDGWEAEDGTVYEANEPVKITSDCTFTARWKVAYNLSVGNVTVKPWNSDDIFGDGSTFFDPRTNTLTINGSYNGYNVSGYGFIEAFDMDLKVVGNADIVIYKDTVGVNRAIYVNGGTLTLAGDFNLRSHYKAISADCVNFESGTINVESVEGEGVAIDSYN